MAEAETMTVTVEYNDPYTPASVFKGLTKFRFDVQTGAIDATGVSGADVPLFIGVDAVRSIHYTADQ